MVSTNSSIRTGLCEEVSSQPDFIRDLADMGFNLENCEVWFERAVIGVMTVTAVVIIVRVSRNILAVCFLVSQRALCVSSPPPHSLSLSYDPGTFRDLHLQLLLAPLPLSFIVNVDHVHGITSRGL